MTRLSSVMPQIDVGTAGSGNPWFGGINGFPQGRGDTTFQYSDTLAWIRGKHSIKFGAEFRRFRNNNFNGGTGGYHSLPVAGRLPGRHAVPGDRDRARRYPRLRVSAFGSFVQDDFKVNAG